MRGKKADQQQEVPSTSTITIMYGNCTFSDWSCRGNVFLLKQRKKGDLWEGKFAGYEMDRIGKPKVKMSAEDGYEGHGKWSIDNIRPVDGKVICLSTTMSRFGGHYASGMIFIRLRESGPLMRVNLTLPFDRNCSFREGGIPMFYGRGDVLANPIEELAEIGIELPVMFYKNNLDEEDLEILYEVITLRRGAPKPEVRKIKTEAGTIVDVAKGPRRRIRIKR